MHSPGTSGWGANQGEKKNQPGFYFFGRGRGCLDTSAVADASYQRLWLVKAELGPKSTIMLVKHTHARRSG